MTTLPSCFGKQMSTGNKVLRLAKFELELDFALLFKTSGVGGNEL